MLLTNETVSIYLYGKMNADNALRFCKNACTRGIYDHGKRIGAMEVIFYGEQVFVEDNGERYATLVSIGDTSNVEKVIRQLKRLGFEGYICIEMEDGCGGPLEDSNGVQVYDTVYMPL